MSTEKETIQGASDKSLLSLIIFLFVFTLGLVAFIYIYKNKAVSTNIATEKKVEETQVNSDYPVVPESKSTPKEVDNTVINELDSLMKDIDASSSEDVSDLSL